MNEIIRREMLAGDLPVELVPGLDPAQRVVVSVSWPEADPSIAADMQELRIRFRLPPFDPAGPSLEDLLKDRHVHFNSVEEIVAHVRAIRDGGDLDAGS